MKTAFKKTISLVVAVMMVFSVVTVAFAAEENVVIENGVLKKCTVSQKCFAVPQEVREISENAFVNCNGLEEIAVGNHVKLIGTGAFLGCPNLKLVCFYETEEITVMDNIVDKTSVTLIVNNKSTALRKSIAMNGYDWCAFECFTASGKNILAFFYGAALAKITSSEFCMGLVDAYHPDYVFLEADNSYYLAKDRTSSEVDYSSKVNPGFFTKIKVNMTFNKFPSKADINNGNDRAKNGWSKLLNAIINAFA